MVQLFETRGSLNLLYKIAFDGSDYELDFLMMKGIKYVKKNPDTVQKPCGISKETKESMLKNFLPEEDDFLFLVGSSLLISMIMFVQKIFYLK